MKKLIALLAIVALLGVVGCCSDPLYPTAKNTFGNCVTKVIKPAKTVLCPPNQEQVDQAAAAANFLAALTGKDWSTQIDMAKQTFLNIAAKICVGLDQLQTAVDTFDSAAVVTQGQIYVQTQPKMMTREIIIPDISALRKALKK